jgi:TonB family protein
VRRIKIPITTLIFLLLLSPLFAADSSPIVKFAVAPKYPTLTLAGRVDGVVSVRVTIDKSGSVKDAAVLKGHPMLRDAALSAAQQWKFEESSAMKRFVTLQFNFVILPENSTVKSQTVFLPPTGIEIRQKPDEPVMQDEEGEFTLDQHPVSMT